MPIPRNLKVYRWYFKHVDDDVFLGGTTPILRRLAREFYQLSLADVRKLMRSAVHPLKSRSAARDLYRQKAWRSHIDNSRSFA